MMKQGWEYKKLGEVCEFQGGSQPPKSEWSKELKTNYIRMLQIRDFTQSATEYIEYVKSSKSLKCCEKDDILLARYGASVGKILSGLSGAYNVAIMKSMPNTDYITKPYIKYYFLSPVFQHQLSIVSQHRAAQAGFSKEDIFDFQLPIPPISQQQSIVAELDKINEIIDLKKAQLKDLDLLAQSIFYEMFGDPIENPKGWEVCSMPDVCSIIDGDRGKNYPKQEDFTEQGFCLFLNAKNVTSRGFNFDVCSFISKEKDEILRKGKLQRGDVVLTTRGTIGNLAFYNSSVPYDHMRINSGMVILRMNKEIMEEVFFIRQFSFHLENIKQRIASGSAQPQLPISTMNKIILILPPLSLQQSFASKIQAIESQKSAIKQSLAEMETLLASRMDYWFN